MLNTPMTIYVTPMLSWRSVLLNEDQLFTVVAKRRCAPTLKYLLCCPETENSVLG